MASVERSGAIQYQPRDFAVLEGLFEGRVMTSSQIADLYFGGRTEAAKKRLQALKRARVIAERPRRRFEPTVLYLTRAGLVLLGERGLFDVSPIRDVSMLVRRAQVSDATIAHELEVMDVKVSFVRASRAKRDLRIVRFSTWPALNQFEAGVKGDRTVVKPDGFMRLEHAGVESLFFLELDRSTESLEILVAKARRYVAHYRSGDFAVREGVGREEFREHPFRVLFVLQTAERRNNVAEALLRCVPPIYSLVWLATRDEALLDPFGPVWIRPIDYREAVKGTSFEHLAEGEYRRHGERERLVESRISKHRLIEGDDGHG